MKQATEVKIFEIDEDGDYGFGQFDDSPNQIGFIAQDKQGRRRVIMVPCDPFTLQSVAIGLCELAGITKLHHRPKLGHWDVSFGPPPERPAAWEKAKK